MVQSRTRIRVERDDDGDRTGFQGRRYRSRVVGRSGYDDRHGDYVGFLEPRLREARRILEPDGSFFLHIDYREAHYCKILLDEIFGRASFMNEIVWAYDYGAARSGSGPPSTTRSSGTPGTLVVHLRLRRDGPDPLHGSGAGRQGEGRPREDAHRRVVAHHREPDRAREDGIPTQKPLGILERIVKVHSRPGDTVLDFFAGSGTTGEAAARHGRRYVLVDSNPEAVRVMAERLADYGRRPSGSNGKVPRRIRGVCLDRGPWPRRDPEGSP